MQDKFEAEIIRLHKFFTDWYNGNISNTDTNFNTLKESLHEKFYIITPNGQYIDFFKILDYVQNSYNSKTKEQEFTIEIKNINHRYSFETIHVYTYEEWQIQDNVKTHRVSSAVFKEEKPDKIQWVAVHETWF